ncbi:MAG: beta-lactamase family protein [bacterium]|nr:beta-lactamase family protein [bacterium]
MKCFHNIEIVFFLIAMTLVCCGLKKDQSSGYVPIANWRASTPEEQGFDSEQLANVFDFVKENDSNIHSLILARNGYLVLEAYFYPNSNGIVHDVASVTKSITSILIGIAVDQGFIKNVQQPVLDFFPDRKIANLDDRKKRLTIEHLLTMQTGLCRNFQDGERQLDAMRETDDWVQFMLDQPMLSEPGTEFAYCTGGTHLLSAIITQATGMNELDFARKYLFEPLGIHDVIWPFDPQGNNTGGFDLHLHSIDMAKIGHLLLNNGVWNGRQILSNKWIEQATKVQVTLDDGERYGYLFWSPNENPDLIEGRGRGGQRLIFSRQSDIILVFTGSGFDPGEIGAILLPALRANKPLPENPEGFKLLQSKIEAAAKAPALTPVPKLPAIAKEISGKTYLFEPNSTGWISFSLVFKDGSEALLKLTEEDHSEENQIGLDGRYRISNNSRHGLPEALKGSWRSDYEFELLYNEFANNHFYRITITFPFDKNICKFHAVESTGLLDITVIARLLQ